MENFSVMFEQIYKRNSFHLFRNIGKEQLSSEELEDIIRQYQALSPLCPDIHTKLQIIPASQTSCRRGAEYCLCLYFVEYEGETIQVFRHKKPGKRGIMPVAKVSYYNQIDIGIFLYFMDLCLTHKNISYQRTLYGDPGGESEKNTHSGLSYQKINFTHKESFA